MNIILKANFLIWKMVNTIRFRFDLTRFRKAFPVCNILTIRYTSRKKPQNAFFFLGREMEKNSRKKATKYAFMRDENIKNGHTKAR